MSNRSFSIEKVYLEIYWSYVTLCIQNLFAKFDVLKLTMTPSQKRPTRARKVPNCGPAAEPTDAVEKLRAEIAAGTADARHRMAAAARENKQAMAHVAMLQRTLDEENAAREAEKKRKEKEDAERAEKRRAAKEAREREKKERLEKIEAARAAEARRIEEERRRMESRKASRLEELREGLKHKRAPIGSWLPAKSMKTEKGAAGMGRKARMDGDEDGDEEEEEDQVEDEEEDVDEDEDEAEDEEEEEEQDVDENDPPENVDPQRGISSDAQSDHSVNRNEQSASPPPPRLKMGGDVKCERCVRTNTPCVPREGR